MVSLVREQMIWCPTLRTAAATFNAVTVLAATARLIEAPQEAVVTDLGLTGHAVPIFSVFPPSFSLSRYSNKHHHVLVLGDLGDGHPQACFCNSHPRGGTWGTRSLPRTGRKHSNCLRVGPPRQCRHVRYLATDAKDGQEVQQLPQGGWSLRDNVDTSVTLQRTFTTEEMYGHQGRCWTIAMTMQLWP